MIRKRLLYYALPISGWYNEILFVDTGSLFLLFASYRGFTVFKQYTITFYSFHVDCDVYIQVYYKW